MHKNQRFLKAIFLKTLLKKHSINTMHVLQSQHKKMKAEEVEKLLDKFRIGLSQLPKISQKDPALPEGCNVGDVIEIKREDGNYYRIVVNG